MPYLWAGMVRVFHCDDSLAFRELIRAELEDDPEIAVVGGAPDLDLALGEVSRARPDVVLLDLLDVERDAIGELRRVAPGVHVVLLTGHVREYAEARRADAEAYVGKDAPIDDLRDAVLRVTRG